LSYGRVFSCYLAGQ